MCISVANANVNILCFVRVHVCGTASWCFDAVRLFVLEHILRWISTFSGRFLFSFSSYVSIQFVVGVSALWAKGNNNTINSENKEKNDPKATVKASIIIIFARHERRPCVERERERERETDGERVLIFCIHCALSIGFLFCLNLRFLLLFLK